MVISAPGLLCEVLDDSNAPLCLMPLQEIRQQKLRHRCVASLPRDSSRFLLRVKFGEKGQSVLDIPFTAPLPAGVAASDFAVTLAQADQCICETVRHMLNLNLDGSYLQIFDLKFSHACLSAQERSGLELVEGVDLPFFWHKKLLGPMLTKYLEDRHLHAPGADYGQGE